VKISSRSNASVVVTQRALDVADVSQRDWHSNQVILYTNHTTKLDHAVLIDFASTTQTWEPHELNYIQNYFGLLQADVALDSELVWKHYGEPDDQYVKLI
jgi:hypothetical protein